MDAVKFLKTWSRMCNGKCRECEYGKRSGLDPCMIWQRVHPEEAVAIVEQWAKEHPAKTRQSVFLEQYPKAELDVFGVVTICPAPLSDDYRNSGGGCKHPSTACFECRRKFWLAEVEDV